MKKLYECEIEKRSELTAILEADPYAQNSLARIGYKMKEGSSLGEDEKKLYVYVDAEEEKVKVFDEKLKEIAKPSSPEDSSRIIAKIDEEEAGAVAGVGAIFG